MTCSWWRERRSPGCHRHRPSRSQRAVWGRSQMRKTVLICGSRIWTDRATIARVMRELDPGTLIVHGAARGADRLADEVARDLGLPRKACPADWGQYGRAAGPIRNQQMLDLERPDRVLAFRVP